MKLKTSITILLVSFFALSSFASSRYDDRHARRNDKRNAFIACAQAYGLKPSRKLKDEMDADQREKINRCLISKGHRELRERPQQRHESRRSHDDRDNRAD